MQGSVNGETKKHVYKHAQPWARRLKNFSVSDEQILN